MIDILIDHLNSAVNNYPLFGPIAAFFGGVLVSFSPCVYPLIPVTLGVIGSVQANSRRKSFLAAVIFVFGIATTFTLLGVIFSLLGRLFFWGEFYGNPYLHLFLGFMFIGFGLASLKIIHIPFLGIHLRFAPAGKRKGYVYLMGVLSGLGISPCLSPVLGAILSLIAIQRSLLYGAVTLFAFSMGYGFLLIVFGVFATLIWRLPKAGRWLIIIERLFSFILIAVGVYFFVNFYKFISQV